MTLAIRLGIAAALLIFAAPATADEAADALSAFNSLYGGEFKRASATFTADDDIVLAAKLLEAARTPSNPPAMLTVLCEKAYELAMGDPGGYATALAAMELLAEKVPAKKAECAPKILAVQMRVFPMASPAEKAALGEKLFGSLSAAADVQAAAGDLDGAVESVRQALGIAVAIGAPAKDDFQARLAALMVRQQKQKQVAALKAKLAANPQDAATRKELLNLYVTDVDNPAEALKILDGDADDTTRKLLPEAAKRLEQVPEAVCPALGDWYRGMADQATAVTSKAVLLVRAKGYYQRFIEQHAAEDLARTTAKLALAKVGESLAALPPGVVPVLRTPPAPPPPPPPPPPPTVVAKSRVPKPPPAKEDPPRPPDPPATPELINGARFFGVAARSGGAFTPGPDGWYDYLQHIDPEKNTVAGKWDFTTGDALIVVSGTKNGRLVLPITAPGSYELEVGFTRTLGADAVVVLLPVGRAACALLVGGEGGTASGLDLVNNKPYKDNETSVRPASLFNDSKYTVLARVLVGKEEAEVIVTLNGKPYIKWKGPPSALSRAETWKLPDGRCPGLGSCDSSVIFHKVRMRTLTGDGTPAK